MRRILLAVLCLGFAGSAFVGFAGCLTLADQKSVVRKRAKFDLKCEKLLVFRISGNTFGVIGCGKNAAYYLKGCHIGEGDLPSDCNPLLNSQSIKKTP
jgi:hypothetical protein